MKKVLVTLFGTLLVLPAISQISYAQNKPECQYSDSDPDGDGFGWENRDTCIVTGQATQPQPTTCIDDDGDGYGWNGREVCRVDIEDCHDSDPVGDGWGWNGVTSCRITAFPSPFSELEVLRTQNRTLFGESIAVASLICTDEQGNFDVFDMSENGTVTHNNPLLRNGIWTTGFSDSDGIVHVFLIGADAATRRYRILLQPDSIALQDASPFTENSMDCDWAT